MVNETIEAESEEEEVEVEEQEIPIEVPKPKLPKKEKKQKQPKTKPKIKSDFDGVPIKPLMAPEIRKIVLGSKGELKFKFSDKVLFP